jgi:hypothetical protein
MTRLNLFRFSRLLVSLLLVIMAGCVSGEQSDRQATEVRGKEICDAVRDYMSKNAIEDSLLHSQMQEIKLEKMHVSSDKVIWFGENWRYEGESNRLFNKGVKIGGEITCFVINFQLVNGGLIVHDAKTVRYYGTEGKP